MVVVKDKISSKGVNEPYRGELAQARLQDSSGSNVVKQAARLNIFTNANGQS